MDAEVTAAEGAAHMQQAVLTEARRRDGRITHLSVTTRRRRLIGWLQRGGHEWPVVRHALDDLQL